MVAAQDDDTLVRKRLLYQSVSTRGEPPFKRLAVQFVQFSKDLEAGHLGKARDAAETFRQALSGIEFMGQKLLAVQDANNREQKSYGRKQSELEGSIEQVRKDIEAKKAELVQARIKRQQKEEYERLRDACMKFERRSATGAATLRLQEGIQSVEASIKEVDRADEMQNKRFAVLAHYMSQLEGELEEEAGGPDDEAAEHFQS
ncbi:hypothetical protein WJX84_006448 [Apatococcus fuscideae]|uniref:Uncharacterized protein n=1 Tax=Apatococcus fuscideae TaxID=2026836 RepID=A0AAW1TJ89_9CHLO